MPNKSGNPWTTLCVKPQYENPWIKVVEHDVLNPKGHPGIYGTVHFKNLATGVVPLEEDGTTYLVGQYRYALGHYSWEIPEGGGARDVPPQDTVERELMEETGLMARHWREVVRVELSNSVSDEIAYGYLAWGLEQGIAQPEDCEELRVRRLPFREALAMAMDGTIRDVLSVATLFKIQLLAAANALPTDVQRRLVR